MLVARSRTETDLQQYLTHTFIRQILHQSIAFILILLSSISITQFRQYNTNPIFIQHLYDRSIKRPYNQLNIHIIAHTIVSTNVSAVNRPCERLHVALHKALHKALPKLCRSSAQSSTKALHEALLRLYMRLCPKLTP